MSYIDNPGSAVTMTPSADKQFLVEYRHNNATCSLTFYAEDWQDAQRKLRSLATNGRVIGEVVLSGEVPGGSFLVRIWKFLSGRTDG